MFQRKNTITQELSRKGAHAFLALFFALLAPHATATELIALCLFLAFCFTLYRNVFGSRNHLFFVPRTSYGEFYFLLGVSASALLTKGDIQLFQLSMVVLGVADSLSALFGMYYGKYGYSVFGEKRTVEGSGIFALTTLFFTLLFGFSLTSAFTVALFVTVVEALSVRGADNCTIPVAVVGALSLLS